jgi:riboflavin kinase / FMN adenylyltransferase
VFFDRMVGPTRERGVHSVAVTFDRHPREILTPGQEPRLLTTVERKAGLIEASGIDALVVLAFTEGFSRVSAEAFVRDVLVKGLHAVHAVMGVNFTFGHRAAGTVERLPEIGAPYGLTAEGVPLLELEGRRVSSSSVREALAAGDLAWPLQALGRRFVLDGEVVSGHGRGKGLGYPTANLRTWPRLLLPGQGIYAGAAEHRGRRFPAAIDVGTNPTFGVEALHVEAFLLDFEGQELRGEPLAVSFWERLRDEVRYTSVEELVRAIAGDVERTRAIVPAEPRPP